MDKAKKTEKTETAEVEQPSKVLDYLSLSAHYLINQQQSDGFFKYEYDFITGSYTPWDNVVHQTRAGYVFIQYYSFLIKNNLDQHLSSMVLEATKKAIKGYGYSSLAHNDMPGKLISFYYNKSGLASADIRRFSIKHRRQRLEAEISATAFALMTENLYWWTTSDNSFQALRQEWLQALVYHMQTALNETPTQRKAFMPHVWLALAIYNQIDPSNKSVAELLSRTDAYFTNMPRSMKDVEDYTWDMLAANQRYQQTNDISFVNFAARQTTLLLENIYTQHDTTINSCSLSLGLVEASLILSGRTGDFYRIEQTALGRSQLEYYSSLKYAVLPNQTWISLGPGRTLHSQDFKRFAGAFIYGRHMPRTNIGLIENCLLNGMRFSNEDIKELKQTGKE